MQAIEQFRPLMLDYLNIIRQKDFIVEINVYYKEMGLFFSFYYVTDFIKY